MSICDLVHVLLYETDFISLDIYSRRVCYDCFIIDDVYQSEIHAMDNFPDVTSSLSIIFMSTSHHMCISVPNVPTCM